MDADQTRVLSTAGETIATYGHEFYSGHVAAIVYELNPHLRVQSSDDGGKTWHDVTEDERCECGHFPAEHESGWCAGCDNGGQPEELICRRFVPSGVFVSD